MNLQNVKKSTKGKTNNNKSFHNTNRFSYDVKILENSKAKNQTLKNFEKKPKIFNEKKRKSNEQRKSINNKVIKKNSLEKHFTDLKKSKKENKGEKPNKYHGSFNFKN